tara:strand:- start:53204 stop:54388 length:1185 start_codon:yes stop_codon:yes gene_type:complete
VHALLLTIFIDTVGFGIILPLLPYFAERFGASPLQVTLLATVFSFSQFVFAPLWGRLSDRIGRRPIILITLAGMFLGYLALTVTDSLLMLFLARGFIGSMAANSGVIQAFIADITTTEARAGAMAKVGAANGLGFIVGPAIGGLFAGSDPVNPNLALPFIIAASLSGFAFCIACIQVRETVSVEIQKEAAEGQRSLGRVFLEAVRIPQLALLFVVVMMTPFVFSGIETTFVLWSERMLGWGPLQNGWIYTFMGLTAAATQWLLVGRLTRRFGEHRLICTGAVMIFIGSLILPFMTGTFGLCVAFGFIVFGVSINNPSFSSLVSKYAHASERGSLLGLSQSCSAMARITGPAWAGFAFGEYGPDWPFLSGAAVMVVMFVLATRVKPAAGTDKASK